MSTATLQRKRRLVVATDLDADTILAAVRNLEEIVVTDDEGMPLGRFTPAAVEVERRKDFFTHYPHDALECLHSCWRHPRPASSKQTLRSAR